MCCRRADIARCTGLIEYLRFPLLSFLPALPFLGLLPAFAFLSLLASLDTCRMPAYRTSGWYAVLFIAFVILFTYFFMSVTLAVVYLNYRLHLKVRTPTPPSPFPPTPPPPPPPPPTPHPLSLTRAFG